MQSFKLSTCSEKEVKQLCQVITAGPSWEKVCRAPSVMCALSTIISVLKPLIGIHNMVIVSLGIQLEKCMHTLAAAVGLASDYSTRHSLNVYLACIVPYAK